MTYIPNGTRSRLNWVLDTHRKRPVVAYEVAVIVMYAIGHDRTAEDMPGVGYSISKPRHGYEPGWWLINASGRYLHPVGELDAVEAISDFDEDRREVDAIIPWLAKVVSSRVRAVERAQANAEYAKKTGEWLEHYTRETGLLASRDAYYGVVAVLSNKAAAIAMMVADERVDLSRMDFDDVIERLKHYTPRVQRVVQGKVVFEWTDGWTVQKLEDAAALKMEGEIMQHCVGSYCAAVESGEADIFSLRDPLGNPHVTMEFDDNGALLQAKGKQNDAPKEEYAVRVLEWVMSHEPDAMTVENLVALARDAPSQRDVVVEYIKSHEILDEDPMLYVKSMAGLGEHDFSDLDLRGISSAMWLVLTVHYAKFDGTDFTNADLFRAYMHDCRFTSATFDGAKLIYCQFHASSFGFASMRRMSANECSFRECRFEGTTFDGSTFKKCNFSDAVFVGLASARGARFVDCKFGNAWFTDTLLDQATFEFSTSWDRETFKAFAAFAAPSQISRYP